MTSLSSISICLNLLFFDSLDTSRDVPILDLLEQHVHTYSRVARWLLLSIPKDIRKLPEIRPEVTSMAGYLDCRHFV